MRQEESSVFFQTAAVLDLKTTANSSFPKDGIHQESPLLDFPGGPVVKNPPANAGDTGSSPGSGRSHVPRNN